MTKSSGETPGLVREAQAWEVAELANEVKSLLHKVEGGKDRRTTRSLLSANPFTKEI